MEKVITIINTPTHKKGDILDRWDLEVDRLNFPEVYRTYNNFEDLNIKVVEWAREKGILESATPQTQAQKTVEEVNELLEALHYQNHGNEVYINSKGKAVRTHEEIEDAIADVLITLIIQAEMQGLNIVDCLSSAYNVISKRTGRMIDGTFVKDNER